NTKNTTNFVFMDNPLNCAIYTKMIVIRRTGISANTKYQNPAPSKPKNVFLCLSFGGIEKYKLLSCFLKYDLSVVSVSFAIVTPHFVIKLLVYQSFNFGSDM